MTSGCWWNGCNTQIIHFIIYYIYIHYTMYIVVHVYDVFFTWYMLLQMGNRERAVYLDGWGILTCMSHNSQNISRHPRIWWVWSPTWTKMPKHQDPKGPPKSVVIVTTTGAQVERGCYCSRFASRTWFQQGDRSRQIYYFQKGCLVVGSQGVYNHLVTCCLAVSRQISVFSEAYCKSFGQETHGIFFGSGWNTIDLDTPCDWNKYDPFWFA